LISISTWYHLALIAAAAVRFAILQEHELGLISDDEVKRMKNVMDLAWELLEKAGVVR
jgi:hypothetical protein